MKQLIYFLVAITAMVLTNCNEVVSTEDPKVPIIIDYMYYSNGEHGSLYVKHNNEILYILEERDYDTLYVPLDWIVLSWEQSGKYEEEIFPKAWREYNIYNSMFNWVD